MQSVRITATSCLERFNKLRNFKKEHPDLVVTKKGFAITGCGQSYYFAYVQYGC